MEIKDNDELRKYLTENHYIVIIRRGKTKQHVHKGNCTSLTTHKYMTSKFRQTKARKQYFVFNTLNEACNKYFESVARDNAEKSPKKYNPYCQMCLTVQHREWLKTYYKSKDNSASVS